MGKSKSKRCTLKQKYKVERKCREHDKKTKKLAKLHPELVRKKDKEIGIPNLWPYKKEMLAAAENAKLEEIAKRNRERDLKKAVKEREKNEAIRVDIEEKEEYENVNTVEGKRKWFFRELTKVVDASDIILQVLDARDPMGSRALDIERRIAASVNEKGFPNKRLVLVMNKIDLVPPEVTQNWVSHLRREHPTIAFKASTHKHRGHMNRIETKSHKVTQKGLDSKGSVGAPALLQLLKNYCRSHNLKTGMTVGIIGYPNVGKSSVVNSLKMMRTCQVSAAAGCTKSLQQVRLDGNIMLVDSPGVLFSADVDNEGGDEGQRNLLLRNVLRVDQVEDPINAVNGILTRCTKEQLLDIYKVGDFKNSAEFLMFVAHKRGKIGKGGVPNLEEAARCVLQDWNDGKIPFYTVPPVTNDVVLSSVVSGFAEEFDIDALLDDANNESVKVIREVNLLAQEDQEEDDMDDVDDLGFDDNVASMVTANDRFVVEESDDSDMDDEEEQTPVNRLHPKELIPLRNTKIGRAKASKVLDKEYVGGVAPVLTKAQQKKNAKKVKRAAMVNEESDGEDYDFDDY